MQMAQDRQIQKQEKDSKREMIPKEGAALKELSLPPVPGQEAGTAAQEIIAAMKERYRSMQTPERAAGEAIEPKVPSERIRTPGGVSNGSATSGIHTPPKPQTE